MNKNIYQTARQSKLETPPLPVGKFSLAKKIFVAFVLMLAMLFANNAQATVYLTISNAGCQTMKVYKNSVWGELYQTTLNANQSWSTWTSWGEKFIYRKPDGSMLGSYTVGTSYNQSHDFNSGGCGACSSNNATGGTPITKYQNFNGKYDYKIIGNTESTNELCPSETNNTSASLSLPSGSTVAAAYLYWSGSGSADNTVTLNGNSVSAQRTFSIPLQDSYWNMTFFGAFANVTNLVTGNGTYFVNNLSWNKSGQYCSGYSAYGGWALVVVYQNNSLPDASINVYDGFRAYWPAGIVCNTLDQLSIPTTCSPQVQMTHVTWEGDNYKGEKFYINDNFIGDNTLNGSTAPNLDIDTYDVSSYVSGGMTAFPVRTESYLSNNAIEWSINNVYVVKVNACSPCANQGGDSDGDGVCNNQDCQPNNPAIPAVPGTACNDNNPNTTNDVIQANGCTCAGTVPNPCANQGGDSDGDGVCNNQDCQPNNPAIPATPGTACNDGNSNTTNDVIQADGCTCAGTPVNNGPNCTTDITITAGSGSISVTGLGVAPISSLQIFTSTWQTQFSCFANCGASQTVNVPAGTYYVFAKYYTAGYALICEKQQTVTVTSSGPVCDNFTNGGTIGFGSNCASSTTICNTAAPSIANCTSPSGGSGNMEIIWLKSTTSCSMPTTTAAQIIAGQDPHWQYIPGQTGLTYNPGNVSVSTCYLRCSRRAGCDTYTESNIISLNVDCGGGGNPDCANISITTGAGSITVAGLDGAPISSLQVFSTTWQQVYNCFANCGASQTVNVQPGDYYVYTKYYSAGYALICEKNLTVTVGGTTAGPVLSPADHPKFVNNLPSPPRINAMNGGTYNIGMEESTQYLGLFDANGNLINTKVWGYSYNGNKMYLGPTFIAKKDVPVDIKWINNLPMTHLLPVDHSIHMAHPMNGVPTVVHLHGGHVEAASDGYPEAWFTQNWAEKGAEFKKQTYHYANDQEAAPLWYHDHTLGITRLNVYAGLAGMYLLRDNNELAMTLPTGNYERELVVQDKQFSADGSMYFPALLSDPEAMDFPTNPAIEPTIFPEFFGNYIMVNGMVWPKLDVQPTKYRFRVLNASDSRFYIFRLSNGANFYQIGTDGGLLNSPVTLNQLVLAPGERADIVIDFTTMAGQSVTLQNFGPDMPFMGLAANQMPADPATTGQIMRFNVGTQATAFFTIPNTLRQPIQYLGQETNTRQLLLLEGTDVYGRLQPSLGTAVDGALGWMDPTTENPVLNETEVWEIYNNTGDAHPIHVHQVEFQLLNRQEFTGDLDPVTSQLTNIQLVGNPIPPAANEMGWKDTYIVPPGHVARYKVKFDLPGKFVWHCHILSHEDHDMMRPFEVMQPGGGGGTGTPDCANVSIMAMPGMIHVSGLDGAPVTSLQVFTSNWQPLLNCFGDCGGATRTVNTGGGTFYVYVKYYDASYQQLCEVNQTVTVPALLTGFTGEDFRLVANKYEEHADIYWMHNASHLVSEYELEVSRDGVNFNTLEKLPSKGGQASEMYQGYDLEPEVGDNFYRVKLHLTNGGSATSETAVLHYNDIADFTLFPNPANSFVKMNLETVVGAEGASIDVFNSLGVKVKRFELDEISSKYFQMDIRDLHEGSYTVWLNVPGKRPVAKKLMVGRI